MEVGSDWLNSGHGVVAWLGTYPTLDMSGCHLSGQIIAAKPRNSPQMVV